MYIHLEVTNSEQKNSMPKSIVGKNGNTGREKFKGIGSSLIQEAKSLIERLGGSDSY